ncbi:MAG: hypothetical protein A3E07_03005 [Candidatus Wildermuthbacteria bacterium RIFCSPHIGHO2_12_FULL_45_9]|nr:MAG: hypothetical protein A2748_02575 [Candidatus Wildermuthbacteria bacterium RIFCSPHIGHO2_01_FULL_45_20]OHA71438.1 MAG: hypothetical protein A3E07_03005 [Candidatus Wildermuthbacteria bacterium RIFCSPHIGHO2_12_FULL_45_9]
MLKNTYPFLLKISSSSHGQLERIAAECSTSQVEIHRAGLIGGISVARTARANISCLVNTRVLVPSGDT